MGAQYRARCRHRAQAPHHGRCFGGRLMLSPQRRSCLTVCGVSRDAVSLDVNKLYSTDGYVERLREQADEQDRKAPRPSVYTVRIHTGQGRRDGLDDYQSGVELCLLGSNGNALLHRICQIEDSRSTKEYMAEVCKVMDADGGARCDILNDTKALSPGSTYVKRRFQSGSIDEVSFLGPDLGPLRGALVGPEHGGWRLQEMVVSNSRESGVSHRFICRDALGTRNAGAAYMTPLPPGTVVYGSGEQAVVMTQSQANSLRKLGLEEYKDLKGRIFSTTAAMVLIGIAISSLAGGVESAEAFAVGGALAFVYQALLNFNVDSLRLVTEPEIQQQNPGFFSRQASGDKADSWLRKLLGNSQFRIALAAGALLCVMSGAQMWTHESDEGWHSMTTVLTVLMGFMTYKLAIIAVTLTPQKAAHTPARTIEKL